MVNNIQLLRAIAALYVLLFHANDHYAVINHGTTLFSGIAKFGYSGVDLFFVISGFVITLTANGSPITFLKRRFARIYLGHWPVLAIAWIVLAMTWPDRLNDVDIAGSIFLYSINMHELLNPVTWSLTYELYFYLIFFFLMLIPKTPRNTIIVLLACALLAKMAFIGTGKYGLKAFLFSPYLLEFFLGSILYILKDHLCRARFIPVYACLFIVLFYLGTNTRPDALQTRCLFLGFAFFFLLASFIALESSKSFISGIGWTRMGDASYSIYLSHPILLHVFAISGLRDWIAQTSPITANALFLLCLCLITGIGYILSVSIEQPLYKAAKRKLS